MTTTNPILDIDVNELSTHNIDDTAELVPDGFDFQPDENEGYSPVYPELADLTLSELADIVNHFGIDVSHIETEVTCDDPECGDVDYIELSNYDDEPRECETCGGSASVDPDGFDLDDVIAAVRDGIDLWPMMNYRYPVNVSDPEGAQLAIALHTSCTLIVDNATGDHYLALTGGGMDLSWDICTAYMLCGQLPPLHFAASLPRFAGESDTAPARAIVLQAALRAARINSDRARYTLESIEERIANPWKGSRDQ